MVKSETRQGGIDLGINLRCPKCFNPLDKAMSVSSTKKVSYAGYCDKCDKIYRLVVVKNSLTLPL